MARWIRNQYDKALTYENLMKAHKLSKRGKFLRKDVILFSMDVEENIQKLYEELKTGKYQHGSNTSFKIYEPKERIIEKAPYRDRIVHRWVVDNFLMPYYGKSFIKTTYACLEGRGLHKAAKDLQQGMISMKKSYREYYVLKMDVSKYFNSIDKNILYIILKRRIKDPKVLWLIKKILTAQNRRTGLEIGNYTSQTFANIYLNEVDQYAVNELKVKYYYRYMDDTVILVKTKKEAKEILNKIEKFLKENLNLSLNKKTQIFKSKQGINFCGYKINEYRLKIRDKGKKKFKKKVKKLLNEIKEGKITSKDARIYLTGHIGYFETANTYNLKKRNIFLRDDIVKSKIFD